MQKTLLSFRRVLFFSLILWLAPALAQDHEGPEDGAAIYRSEVDELLTVRKLTLLPFSDNVDGIYSRPLEAQALQIIKDNHRWDVIDANSVGPLLSPEELESSPETVKSLAKDLATDALLVGRITKGPNGISLLLDMFLTKDGKLFAQGQMKDLTRFEIAELKNKTAELMTKVLGQIPYQGLVMSRQGQRVTLNLGKKDGMEPERVVNAIQIIKVTRHPRFQFLINTEHEILGKIKIVKADETLSFGRIVSEKGKNTVQKNTKISGVEFVSYTAGDDWEEGKDKNSLMERADSQITFGENAKEWVPRKPPTFGQIGARLGLGMYNGNMKLTSENLEAKSPFYPAVGFEGEMWLTPEWTLHAGLRQGIIAVDNPKSGTGTKELSQSLSSYELLMGYTSRFGSGVWGPKVEFLAGYGTYRLFVDDTTDGAGNHGLTTLQYSGLKFGMLGSYPVTVDQLWAAGVRFYFFLNPGLKESPLSSGSSKNTVNQFGFFADRRLSPNLKAQVALDFELYSTEFGGGGRASSASQKHTTLSTGLHYLF